ncbi:MAG: thioredoxin family protein [Bacteroidales bacterium]|jgi:small redox-active disulfide protein 2|nr:thioredoxin family protein [Bacteroidales bacterium]MCI1785777.1 thioredoxin family protein [Bacteroidales bacterium]
MEIKILGSGCSRCKALEINVKKACEELNLDAGITEERDMAEIISYNVMGLPALVVDEKVISAGKVLSVAEIRDLLSK